MMIRANIYSERPTAGTFLAVGDPPRVGETIAAYNYATGKTARYTVMAVNVEAGTYEAEPERQPRLL
jgi:hypothetical protein